MRTVIFIAQPLNAAFYVGFVLIVEGMQIRGVRELSYFTYIALIRKIFIEFNNNSAELPTSSIGGGMNASL